jgi:multidrug transporter EmrE-like cation transporter
VFIIFLALIYLVTSVSGILLFKLGNNRVGMAISLQGGSLQLQVSYISMLGLLCYVVSFVLFMALLTKHNLTYLLPILTGCLHVLVFLGAVFILKEKVSVTAVAGSLLVLTGVLMIGLAR